MLEKQEQLLKMREEQLVQVNKFTTIVCVKIYYDLSPRNTRDKRD